VTSGSVPIQKIAGIKQESSVQGQVNLLVSAGTYKIDFALS
jgi:hypothetical protein